METRYIYAIAIGAVVLVAILIYFMKGKVEEKVDDLKSQGRQVEEKAAANPLKFGMDPSKPPTLALFHANWCGHCKHFAPEWEKLKSMIPQGISMVDLEHGRDQEALRLFNIEGFPTIRFYPYGVNPQERFVEYSGPRNAESIVDFLNKYINSHQAS